jgi:hypothetical protein
MPPPRPWPGLVCRSGLGVPSGTVLPLRRYETCIDDVSICHPCGLANIWTVVLSPPSSHAPPPLHAQVSAFDDPHEACLSVVAESYRLWLNYETRTDDITMIVLQFSGLDTPQQPPKGSLHRLVDQVSHLSDRH